MELDEACGGTERERGSTCRGVVCMCDRPEAQIEAPRPLEGVCVMSVVCEVVEIESGRRSAVTERESFKARRRVPFNEESLTFVLFVKQVGEQCGGLRSSCGHPDSRVGWVRTQELRPGEAWCHGCREVGGDALGDIKFGGSSDRRETKHARLILDAVPTLHLVHIGQLDEPSPNRGCSTKVPFFCSCWYLTVNSA